MNNSGIQSSTGGSRVKKRVAIVGAGMAGLTCARELVQHGHEVILFEKSRGPGGRMPTRWLNRDIDPPLGFDHGTQYFQASSPAFVRLVQAAQEAGAVAPWTGDVVDLAYGVSSPHVSNTTRWVGTPGMASLGRFMSQGLDLRLQCRVAGVVRQNQFYQLTLHLGDGTVRVESGFDAVVCAVPAEQVVPLFADINPPLANLAAGVKSNVTWSVMLTPREAIKVGFDGAFVVDSPLGWICRGLLQAWPRNGRPLDVAGHCGLVPLASGLQRGGSRQNASGCVLQCHRAIGSRTSVRDCTPLAVFSAIKSAWFALLF